MGGCEAVVRLLTGLGEPELRALLERRPDVLRGTPPRDLSELAERLWHPAGVAAALHTCALPHLQLLEAAVALGAPCDRDALAGLLAGSGPEHRRAVDRTVEELIAAAILVPAGGDGLALPDALVEMFPEPLGLGPPLPELVAELTVDGLRRILGTLGVAAPTNRAGAVAALTTFLADRDGVRNLVGTAPDEVAEYLHTLAVRGPDEDRAEGPGQYRQRQAAVRWAGARGLLIGHEWGFGWQLPAVVGLALRGPDHRAPFTPQPPAAPTRPVDPDRLARDCAAAAGAFAERLTAVLDHIVRSPVPCVKSGGVGTRELARLAKATGTAEAELRLALELAAAQALVERHGQTVAVSAGFAAWREQDPGDRFAATVRAWWQLGATPTEARDEDDRPRRALADAPGCAGCRAARVVLVESLARLDGAAPRATVARAALWHRPLVHVVPEDADRPLATVWREAELLGLIADEALTPLGHALRSGDDDELAARAAALLPPTATRATFGSDLTAYVVGPPSARVSALLDSCADRESRGGATTWRFGPAGVRRALDDGTGAPALLADLADIATGPLPQPLQYLITDVARRHGNLRVSPASSCIRSDDAALLAEVAADRRLARHGLRLLAPTVLAADTDLPALLTALRAAGYFPVAEAAGAGPGTGGAPAGRSRPGGRTAPGSRCTAGQRRRAGSPRGSVRPAAPRAHGPGGDDRPGRGRRDRGPAAARRHRRRAEPDRAAAGRVDDHPLGRRAAPAGPRGRHRCPRRHRLHLGIGGGHPARHRGPRTGRRQPVRLVRAAVRRAGLHRLPHPLRGAGLTLRRRAGQGCRGGASASSVRASPQLHRRSPAHPASCRP